MIVKIQKALNNNSVLIYSKNREICYEDVLTPDIDYLLNGQFKGYFEATVNNQNKLVIGKKVKMQNW